MAAAYIPDELSGGVLKIHKSIGVLSAASTTIVMPMKGR